ncbi:hypothetical protein MUK42_34569 [Musa troglodytarum]|uniref:DEUBAD domain-containing protein n=1 Tax=Musa troglodytarum TaxID=320322 RepID=A0A9E7FCK5_9LILI|nr:hypothetical protein MUK42_34569 [Musa troglodytarum]
MGIIKIRPQGPGNSHHLQQRFVHEEKLFSDRIFSDDHDEHEAAEVGCEYVMIGGQMCSIPYELYDLPDLKGILSFETWNYHLTEDERFSLVAFLPDMDQETFWLTIHELLTGDNMFFGSPLEKFYNGLMGGIYSPQVTRLREDLQFLQRSEYYHNLRSYHENMAETFVEMKKIWGRYRSNISVEERIHTWNSSKGHKPVFVVDLNAFPDEDILKMVERNEKTLPFSKKAKYINENCDASFPLNGLLGSSKRKPMGVLKLKPFASGLVQNQTLQPLPHKPGEPNKQLPKAKGVLKIKPKYDSLNLKKPRTEPEQISANIWGVHAPRASGPQFVFKRDGLNFTEKLPILHQLDRDGIAYGNQEAVQKNELLYAGAETFMDSEIFQRKLKIITDVRQDAVGKCKEQFPLIANQNLRIFPHEADLIGEYRNDKKILYNTNARQNRSIYESSADPKIETFPLTFEKHREKRLNAICEAGLRTADNCTDKHDILTKPSDHLEDGSKDDATNVTQSGAERCFFSPPITYKRKKPYRKINQVDSLKQQPDIVNFEPAAPSGIVKPKPMAIKIKFRGLIADMKWALEHHIGQTLLFGVQTLEHHLPQRSMHGGHASNVVLQESSPLLNGSNFLLLPLILA